jgi:L-iditol 2-dehydrogenase
MSYIEGSLVEPTACCIRALLKASVGTGSTVAVFGVGPVGLTHVQLAKVYGAATIIGVDLLENRRQLAARVGADIAIDPTNADVDGTIKSATGGLGVDRAIVATGNVKALEQAFSSVRKGGLVLLFGAPPRGARLSLDMSRVFLHEITFQSSYSTSETEMRMALSMIERKQIDPSKMVTHKLPLTKVLEAFSLAEKGPNVVKVVVENL